MNVRCISDYITPEQRAALGRGKYQGMLAQGLTIGREYLVLGLSFIADADHFQTGSYVLIQPDIGTIASYDLCLFEITDPRPSRYWRVQARRDEAGERVTLYPPGLLDPTTIAEDDPRNGEELDEAWFAYLASDEYERIWTMLQDEFAAPDSPV
jgi:hypothetical protein